MSRAQKAVLLVFCVAISIWSWGTMNADLRSMGYLTAKRARTHCTFSLTGVIPVAGWAAAFVATGAYYSGWSAQCGEDKP